MAEVTQEWAEGYCLRLLAKYKYTFPITIGRMKVGGYVDAGAYCTDATAFYKAYKEFNDHPRCERILLYVPHLEEPISI